MNVKKIGQALLPALGLVLMFASNYVNGKNQEIQMEKTIEKKVAEALENNAKES